MLQALGLYLAATGGAAAGAQVARGAVRGVARFVRGDVPGALAETAGGLIAPVVTAAHQFSHLGAEVYKAATSLTAEVRGRAASPVVPPPTRVLPRRGRSAPLAVNASA
jgi:hypothetical protein